MFARVVFIKVKPGCELELARTLEQGIIPLFQKEKDFRGFLAFTSPNETKAVTLSFWDQKERVGGICARCIGVLTALAKVALGTPPVQIYEVSNSAFHTTGQTSGHANAAGAPPDLRIYQTALRPSEVSPARHTRGRGLPLVRGLINSFHE